MKQELIIKLYSEEMSARDFKDRLFKMCKAKLEKEIGKIYGKKRDNK